MKKLILQIIAILLIGTALSFTYYHFELDNLSNWNIRAVKESKGGAQVKKIADLKNEFNNETDSLQRTIIHKKLRAVYKEMGMDFVDGSSILWTLKNKIKGLKKDTIQ